MSEEEKKAIDIIKYNDIARPLACGDITICNIEDLKIALNLIEKQRAEIERLNNLNNHQSKEIVKAVDYTFELNAELEKKDKIIDEMANYIRVITVDMKIPIRENMLWDNEEIKQCFERKVENVQ